jgi:dTDP-4-amino-4,6-dideoxygalactose transaminase
MAAIHALSQRYGFKIIEDASHAIGGKYKGEYIGNSRYSDITVFSFHPVKIITTAEGGMAMTNDPVLAENMLLLRSHGITRDPVKMTHEPDGPWYYQQIALGFNYRLTDLQAALGLSQLARLEIFVERRRYLAARYDSFLEQLPVSQPWQHPECLSARHLYVIRVQDRNKVFHHLREAGIGANVHYIPVNQQPYYQSSFGLSSTPEADRYYREAISIPLYSALTQDDQDAVIDSLTSVLSGD